jgi:hypothetical protein
MTTLTSYILTYNTGTSTKFRQSASSRLFKFSKVEKVAAPRDEQKLFWIVMMKVRSLPNLTSNTNNHAVSVYDACNADFNLQEHIGSVKDKLPKFEGEIPRGSFVALAYTAACYQSSKAQAWHLSFNLQWAIVMGVPTQV